MHHTILIVEDDTAVAKGLRIALTEEGFAVRMATTTAEADAVFAQSDGPAVDVVLLDVRLPGENGLDYCRRLRSQNRQVGIIMVTARDDETDRVLGLELGADDYVVKPFGLKELVSRIRALIRRLHSPDPGGTTAGDRLNVGGVSIDRSRLTVTFNGSVVTLTPMEFRLLVFFATNPDSVLSRTAILDALWGSDYFGDERTIDVHVRRLREKFMAVSPTVQPPIETIRGFGYRFRGSTDEKITKS